MRSHIRLNPIPLLCLLVVAASALAQPLDTERLAKVQAAYLLNFVRYTTWPDHAFADRDSAIRIVIVGEPDLLPYTLAIVRGEEVLGRPLRVRSLPPPPSGDTAAEAAFYRALGQAHMVYLPGSQARLARPMIDRLRRSPVLMVSDAGGFAAAGGTLQLALDNDRVVFYVNVGAAGESGVRISSKVLRLAHRLFGEEER